MLFFFSLLVLGIITNTENAIVNRDDITKRIYVIANVMCLISLQAYRLKYSNREKDKAKIIPITDMSMLALESKELIWLKTPLSISLLF